MERCVAEQLFPPIEPYYSDYLAVGDGHELYYEICGNPNGIPVLCLHGGPGIGCNEIMRRFFDPEKYCIILFDQRGSGKSKPRGSIYANTTSHLIQDINTLLDLLGEKNVLLFGGSWGSTLALVYAIKYPERVLGMVLRGIFLAENQECREYLSGQIHHSHFPEICDRLLENVPEDMRKAPADYYVAQMTFGASEIARAYAYEWLWYEFARAHIIPPSEEDLKQQIFAESIVSRIVVELSYMRNFCYLQDGYIMKNIHRIPSVPISIIHGRYDDICSVNNAIRLHRALASSKLHIVVAGHAGTDPAIYKKIISETNSMISELVK